LLGLESDVDLAVAGMAAGAVVMETGSPSFKKLAAAAKGFHHESRSLTPPIGPPERWDTLDAERASLVAARNIYAGEILSPEMIAAKAPYRGLSPRLLDYAVGLRALYDILEDEPLTFGNISA
jgi:sialic acid synthase SpsE